MTFNCLRTVLEVLLFYLLKDFPRISLVLILRFILGLNKLWVFNGFMLNLRRRCCLAGSNHFLGVESIVGDQLGLVVGLGVWLANLDHF